MWRCGLGVYVVQSRSAMLLVLMFPKQAMALIICRALHICQVELAAMAAGVAGDSLGVLEGLVSEHHGAQYVNSPLSRHDAPHQPANQSCPCAPTSSPPPPDALFFSPNVFPLLPTPRTTPPRCSVARSPTSEPIVPMSTNHPYRAHLPLCPRGHTLCDLVAWLLAFDLGTRMRAVVYVCRVMPLPPSPSPSPPPPLLAPHTPSTTRYVASVVNKVFGRQAIVVPDAPEGRVGVSVADMGAALAQE